MLPADNRLELSRRMIAVGKSFIFHAAQLKRDPLGERLDPRVIEV